MIAEKSRSCVTMTRPSSDRTGDDALIAGGGGEDVAHSHDVMTEAA